MIYDDDYRSISGPGHRVSFEEKEKAQDHLNRAYGEGRLDDEEFARRTTEVDKLTYSGQLDSLLRDLPAKKTSVRWTQKRANVAAGVSAALSTLIAFMGSMFAYFSTGGSAEDFIGSAIAIMGYLAAAALVVTLCATEGFHNLRDRG